MKGASVRYGVRLGCRWGMPHDMILIDENKSRKIDKCRICGIRRRWNKIEKGRIDGAEYLRMHVRNFAQESGSTKRVFKKIYKPNECTIKV